MRRWHLACARDVEALGLDLFEVRKHPGPQITEMR